MDSQIQARMIEILENDPDFYIPIKKLWAILQPEGLDLSQEEFQRLIQEDERFEVAPGADPEEGGEPELTEEMESLGFYSGPRVKLASREMTAQDIFEGMTRSLAHMNQALQSAWEARPIEDQETENQLLEILAAGQRLEHEIQNLVDQQDQDKNDSVS
jgi:hypothetical protein